jgi:hypothetical protein
MPRVLVAVAVALALAAIATAAAPAVAEKRCTVTKDFDVYAIPSGYEDFTRDVYARGVPRKAKHIGVRFVYAANGRPVRAQAFPGQRWVWKVRGFRRDRSLWIQVTLSGYGFGMPVAKVDRWRAIVSYDC